MQYLDPGYALSHTEPLRCGLVRDLLYLQLPWSIETGYPGFSYKEIRDILIRLDLFHLIDSVSPESLVRARLSPEWAVLASSILTPGPSDRAARLQEPLSHLRSLLQSTPPDAPTRLGRTRMSQIGIVTALPEEWLAITTALNAHEVGSVKNDPNRYATATLPTHPWIIARGRYLIPPAHGNRQRSYGHDKSAPLFSTGRRPHFLWHSLRLPTSLRSRQTRPLGRYCGLRR